MLRKSQRVETTQGVSHKSKEKEAAPVWFSLTNRGCFFFVIIK
ncbi:hypothetical protein ADIAL_1492 [Alkalibacterium sp. AK22]|nr:hypothetical protein ADIAL_1492 [Alkalibacterium sp. AK22]